MSRLKSAPPPLTYVLIQIPENDNYQLMEPQTELYTSPGYTQVRCFRNRLRNGGRPSLGCVGADPRLPKYK